MKKLSDYKGEEAIDLWADLLEPICTILQDDEIAKVYRSGAPLVSAVKLALKNHKKETTEILLRIDPTPIDGINVIERALAVVVDIEKSNNFKSFFGSAGQGETADVSSGNVTANTEGVEK